MGIWSSTARFIFKHFFNHQFLCIFSTINFFDVLSQLIWSLFPIHRRWLEEPVRLKVGGSRSGEWKPTRSKVKREEAVWSNVRLHGSPYHQAKDFFATYFYIAFFIFHPLFVFFMYTWTATNLLLLRGDFEDPVLEEGARERGRAWHTLKVRKIVQSCSEHFFQLIIKLDTSN